MVVQLALGSALIVLTTLVSAGFWVLLELLLNRLHMWVRQPPHSVRIGAVLALSIGLTLAMVTAAVWIWAVALYALGIFALFETAIYFALVAFTTLGFGDILLPTQWRLLGGLAATNGLLLFGLLTAMLVETLRETRARQRGSR